VIQALYTDTALSPTHSAIVEAFAGSGKTWLQVSRMIRLMLAPQQSRRPKHLINK